MSSSVAAIALAWTATSCLGCGSVSTEIDSPNGGAPSDARAGSGGGGGADADGGRESTDGFGGSGGTTDSGLDVASSLAGAGGEDGAAGADGGSGGFGGAGASGAAGSGGSGGASGAAGGVTVTDPDFCRSHADDTSCDDGNACTDEDACRAGVCVGATPNETLSAHQITITCPAIDTASDGMVAKTCDFPDVLSPNNVYTGPVVLVSHLDRDFADHDVNPLGDGRIQLMCVYDNADGLAVGAISRLIVALGCTATSAAGFTCTK